MSRKSINSDDQLEVLVKSKRRCSLCFGLHGDISLKSGQIAHVDQDNGNADIENLVFLCLEHHDQYDSKNSQSKGITEKEVKYYRSTLYDLIEKSNQSPWVLINSSEGSPVGVSRERLPVEIFDRRIEIYRILRSFILKVLQGKELNYHEIFSFSSSTEEAIFLLNAEISNYISDIATKAISLIYANQVISNPNLEPDSHMEYIKQRTVILLWFSEQVDFSRNLFYKYISL